MSPMLLGDDPRAQAHGRSEFRRGFVFACAFCTAVGLLIWWLAA